MPTSLISAKIRGVRSYCPLPEKTQTIEFMPLTLIVGSNGSGKTTIIESLKFIISGDEPPLSDSRRNFLHTSKREFKIDKKNPYASIELHFQNTKDVGCIAKRDILKPGSGPNQTAAVVSSYKIGDRGWTNVHKQADWVATVPSLFNLPNHAILNNVILCHQEDNQWCMGDSSSVKQILDKIFGCERYKKEIKFIDAEIKNCRGELTLGSKDLAMAKEKIERKKTLSLEFDSLNREIEKITLETLSLDSDIKKLADTQSSLQKECREIEDKARKIVLAKQKLLELESRKSTMRQSMRDLPIDPQLISDDDLKDKLRGHSKLIEQTKQRQNLLKDKEQNVKKEIRNLEAKRDSLQEIINKLKVVDLKSRETHQSLLSSLQSIKSAQSIDDIELEDIEASLKVLERLASELSQKKSDQTELEDSLSSKQQQLSREITTLEGMYQGLLQKIKNKEMFVEKLSDQLAQTDPMAQDLVRVTENLIKMSSICRQMEESKLVTSLQNLINDSTDVIKVLVKRIKNDNVTKITNEITRENLEIEDSKSQLGLLSKRKTNLTAEQLQVEIDHNKVRTASKEAHNKVMMFNNARSNILESYKKYQGERMFLESKNMSAKLEELQTVSAELESKRNDLTIISLEHSKIAEDIGGSFEQCEEFKKNLEFRGLGEQIAITSCDMGHLEEDANIENELAIVRARIAEADQHSLEMRDKRSRFAGSKGRIERELNNVRAELARHSNTYSSYAQCLGKVVCNKIVIGDLEKLKECFQKSVSNFHNQMIAKINEVLRIRWRQIYNGSDIDHIELVDEEITRGKDKKVFNYYVAMMKSGQRMKMREKGSAGQKALASIILRMTLAELFVKDFAFIALDEPTANLDLANVQSLAKTIGSYVKRRTQKGINIQWIIITHDENFLRALDAECSPYYYRLEHDREGFSKIIKISYQEASSSYGGSLASTQSSGLS